MDHRTLKIIRMSEEEDQSPAANAMRKLSAGLRLCSSVKFIVPATYEESSSWMIAD